MSFVRARAQTQTHTHTSTSKHTHTSISICTHTSTSISWNTNIHSPTQTHTHTSTSTQMCVYINPPKPAPSSPTLKMKKELSTCQSLMCWDLEVSSGKWIRGIQEFHLWQLNTNAQWHTNQQSRQRDLSCYAMLVCAPQKDDAQNTQTQRNSDKTTETRGRTTGLMTKPTRSSDTQQSVQESPRHRDAARRTGAEIRTYWGVCWLTDRVQKFSPFLLHQENSAGYSESLWQHVLRGQVRGVSVSHEPSGFRLLLRRQHGFVRLGFGHTSRHLPSSEWCCYVQVPTWHSPRAVQSQRKNSEPTSLHTDVLLLFPVPSQMCWTIRYSPSVTSLPTPGSVTSLALDDGRRTGRRTRPKTNDGGQDEGRETTDKRQRTSGVTD